MPSLSRLRPLLALTGCAAVLITTALLERALPSSVNPDLLYVLAVLLALWSGDRRMVWGCAAMATLLTLTGWLLMTAPTSPLYEAINRFLALLGIWVTTLLGLRLEEHHSHLQRFRQMVEQSPVSIMLTDQQGNIRYVNPQFTRTTGYRAEEVLGQNPRILRSGDTPPETYRELWQTVMAGEKWQGRLC
ncbi:MAG: PAS domain S-box protein, partial [Gammaproteobacteria bacterium]